MKKQFYGLNKDFLNTMILLNYFGKKCIYHRDKVVYYLDDKQQVVTKEMASIQEAQIQCSLFLRDYFYEHLDEMSQYYNKIKHRQAIPPYDIQFI